MNLVRRDFTATAPGTKLIGDITYVPTWQGWVYLATAIDCYSKKVIAYAMDDNYKTPLIATAIRRAARNEHLVPGAIFHTDRAATTRRTSSGKSWQVLIYGVRWAERVFATIMRWRSPSSRH